MSRRILAVAASAPLLLSACGTDAPPEQEPEPPAEEETAADETPEAPDPLEWGETGQVTGEGGTAIDITPQGVRYIGAEDIADEGMAPQDGYFAVVTVEAAAAEAQEEIGYTGAGTGFVWRQDGQQIGSDDGNAFVAPWVGSAPDLGGDTVLLPGEDPTLGVEEFDVAEPGGELTYLNPDGSLVRWSAPEEATADSGAGFDEVDEAMQEFAG